MAKICRSSQQRIMCYEQFATDDAHTRQLSNDMLVAEGLNKL